MSKIVIEKVEIEVPDNIVFTEEDAKEWIKYELRGYGLNIENPLAKFDICSFDADYKDLTIQK
jgi:hypothetical protein